MWRFQLKSGISFIGFSVCCTTASTRRTSVLLDYYISDKDGKLAMAFMRVCDKKASAELLEAPLEQLELLFQSCLWNVTRTQ